MLISSAWNQAQEDLNSTRREATFQCLVSLRVLQCFLWFLFSTQKSIHVEYHACLRVKNEVEYVKHTGSEPDSQATAHAHVIFPYFGTCDQVKGLVKRLENSFKK